MAQQESNMDLTNQYNKLAFLTPTIVDLCDTLRESTECKKELKYHINQANKEAQIIREAEKSGLDYTAIEIPFTPL